MKRKVALILALVFVLPVFALVGCTDKTRMLTDIEKQVVGTWEYYNDETFTLTFYYDGTWNNSNGHKGEFWHTGDGVDPILGHYQQFSFYDNSKHALFDNYPKRLYKIDNGVMILRYERK